MSQTRLDPREVLALEKQTAERSLWFFLAEVLGLDVVRRVHGDFVDTLESGDFDELLVMLPRGCFKSTVGVGYIAWRIVRDRDFRCLLVGVTFKKTVEVGNLVRQYLESERVVELFGSFVGDEKWNSEEFLVSGRTRMLREPTLTVMGRDSFKPGGHYDVVWFDDPENNETVSTPEQIVKTQDVDALSYPMADEPGAKRLTTGTFWDDQDLYSHKIEKFRLYERREIDGRVVKFKPPAIRKVTKFEFEDGTKYQLRVVGLYRPAEDPETGELLFPERLSHAALARAKASMTASHYSAQYLLDPVSKETARFLPSDFIYTHKPPEEGRFHIGIDVSQARTRGSDNTGIVVVEVAQSFKFHVHEALRLRIDTPTLWARIVELDKEYSRPGLRAVFCIEEDNFVRGWRPYFEDWLRGQDISLQIEWIMSFTRKKKEDRVDAMEPLFRSHDVTITPGQTLLEEELIRHPAGRFKDVMDSMTNVIEVARKAPRSKLPPQSWGNFRLKRSPLMDRPKTDTRGRNPSAISSDARSSLKY